jgi:hypothetical protein
MPNYVPIEEIQKQADSSTDVLNDWYAEQGITDATMIATALNAHACAVLMQAHEQKRTADALETANLIAYLRTAYQGGLAYRPSAEVLKSVQADVETRLGLA